MSFRVFLYETERGLTPLGFVGMAGGVVLITAILGTGAFLFLRPSAAIMPVGPDGEAWDAEGATVSFAMDEELRFRVERRAISEERRVNVVVRDREGVIVEDAGAEITLRDREFLRASWDVKLSADAFPPFSRFTLEAEGATLRFTRGALVVNTERDIYRPFEKVAFGFALADAGGEPACDAVVTFLLEDPAGRSVARTTENDGIERNPQCALHAVSDDPDYAVDIALGDTSAQGQVEYQRESRRQLGTHQVTVRAEAAGEQIAMRSVFPVRGDAPLIVKRNGPVRIVGGAIYRMEIAVTAAEEFSGTLVEQLPKDFLVSNAVAENASAPQPRETQTPSPPPSGAPTISRGRDAPAAVFWDIEVASGDTARFSYEFVAPPDRPAVWGLTPLGLGGEEEARAWKGIVEPAPYALEIPDPAIIQFGDPAAPPLWRSVVGSDPTTADLGAVARIRLSWEATLRYGETVIELTETSDSQKKPYSWTLRDGMMEAGGEIPGAKATIRYRVNEAGQLVAVLRMDSGAPESIEDIDFRFVAEGRADPDGSTSQLFFTAKATPLVGITQERTDAGFMIHFPKETVNTGESFEAEVIVSGK